MRVKVKGGVELAEAGRVFAVIEPKLKAISWCSGLCPRSWRHEFLSEMTAAAWKLLLVKPGQTASWYIQRAKGDALRWIHKEVRASGVEYDIGNTGDGQPDVSRRW